MATRLEQAQALVTAIAADDARMNDIAERNDMRRKQLKKLIKRMGVERVDDGRHEAVRYFSVGYEADVAALQQAVVSLDNDEALDKILPRKANATEVRRVIDGQQYPGIQQAVRDACTKHSEWKLKVAAIKKKAAARNAKIKAAKCTAA